MHIYIYTLISIDRSRDRQIDTSTDRSIDRHIRIHMDRSIDRYLNGTSDIYTYIGWVR